MRSSGFLIGLTAGAALALSVPYVARHLNDKEVTGKITYDEWFSYGDPGNTKTFKGYKILTTDGAEYLGVLEGGYDPLNFGDHVNVRLGTCARDKVNKKVPHESSHYADGKLVEDQHCAQVITRFKKLTENESVHNVIW